LNPNKKIRKQNFVEHLFFSPDKPKNLPRVDLRGGGEKERSREEVSDGWLGSSWSTATA